MAEALLEAGANARARNRNGALPAHHCKPDSPCEKVLGEWRAYAGHEREQEMRRMLEASAKREEELLRIQRETLSALKEMTGMLALALGIEKAGAEGQAEPEEGNLAKRLRSRPTRGVGEPEKEAGPGGGAGM